MRASLLISAVLLTAACTATTTASPAVSGAAPPSAEGPEVLEVHAPAPATCDWLTRVLPADRERVLADLDRIIASVPGGGQMPDFHDAQLRTASDSALIQVRELLQRARTPLAVGNIAGVWQVRSLQVDADSAFDYPFFRARIDPDACGLRFSKVTGSQRRSGILFPVEGDATRLAFLGTASVNDNPEGEYGADNPSVGTPMGSEGLYPVNSVGQLLRIGERELLMVLDVDGNGFELYHLKR